MMLLKLFALLVWAPTVLSHCYYFASDSYCDVTFSDPTIMGQPPVSDTSLSVVVSRNGVTLSSGDSYVAGETLDVSVTGSPVEYAFTVNSGAATFVDGACGNSRHAYDSQVVMPSSGSVVLQGAWANQEGTLHVMSTFTLNEPVAAVPSVAPAGVPTAAPVSDSTSVPNSVPTEAPVVSSSGVPTVVSTFAPSAIGVPSLAPTEGPTNVDGVDDNYEQTYTFSVTQGLSGITASAFNSDEAHSLTFRQAVADCMDTVTSDDVSITSVTDVIARKLRRLQDSSGAVDIVYSVLFTLNATDLNEGLTADEVYSSYNASLVDAVTSGDFDDYIATYAEANNVTDMGNVTSSGVSVGPLAEVDANDEGNGDDTKDNIPLIVGLTVGIGGALLIAICACLFCCKK